MHLISRTLRSETLESWSAVLNQTLPINTPSCALLQNFVTRRKTHFQNSSFLNISSGVLAPRIELSENTGVLSLPSASPSVLCSANCKILQKSVEEITLLGIQSERVFPAIESIKSCVSPDQKAAAGYDDLLTEICFKLRTLQPPQPNTLLCFIP